MLTQGKKTCERELNLGLNTLLWKQELNYNNMKVEFYRSLLKSSLERVSTQNLQNARYLFAKVQQGKRKQRKLSKKLLDFYNSKGKEKINNI